MQHLPDSLLLSQANDVGDVKQYQEAAALQLLLAEPTLSQPFLVPKLTRYAAKT